jgi:predicted nucleic acid-binding protein
MVMALRRAFLDTSYAVALLSERDQNHGRAVRLARRVTQNNARLVTTQAVLLEIGNTLSDPSLRKAAAQYIAHIRQAPKIDVVPLTLSLFERGLTLYRERTDKSWGLVDCCSFAVMRKRELRDALTADAHFEQAGFRALLRATA